MFGRSSATSTSPTMRRKWFKGRSTGAESWRGDSDEHIGRPDYVKQSGRHGTWATDYQQPKTWNSGGAAQTWGTSPAPQTWTTTSTTAPQTYVAPQTYSSAAPQVISTTTTTTTAAPVAAAPFVGGVAAPGISQWGAGRMNPLVESYWLWRRGEMPHNAQFYDFLDRAIYTLEQERHAGFINTHGSVLSQDVQRILQDLRDYLSTHNQDEHLQKFLYQGGALGKTAVQQGVGTGITQQASSILQPIKGQGQNVLPLARNVGWQLVRSGEFRALLNDLIVLAQEMFQNFTQPGAGLGSTFGTGVGASTAYASGIPTADYCQPASTFQLHSGLGSQVTPGTTFVEMGAAPTYISGDRKQMLLERFRNIMNQLAYNQDFSQLLRSVFNIFDQLRKQALNLSTTSSTTVTPEMRARSAQMWTEGRAVLSSFGGKQNVDNLVIHLNDIFYLMRDDTNTLNFFRDLRAYVFDILNNPVVLQDQARWDNIYNRGYSVYNDPRYNSRYNQIINDLKLVLNSIRTNPLQQRMSNDTAQLFKDLVTDSYGNPSVAVLMDSLVQIKNLIMPVVLKELEFVPLPRLEGSSINYDWWVDNLVINGYDILPNFVDIFMDNDLHMNTYHMNLDKTKAKLTLSIRNIMLHLRDVEFYFKKKTGFPKLEDRGLVDVDTLGRGMNINLYWKVVSRAHEPFRFTVEGAWCDIDRLNIRFRNVRHRMLLNTGVKLWQGRIKRQIQKSIEQALIRTGQGLEIKLNQLGTQIFASRSREPYTVDHSQTRSGKFLNQTLQRVKGLPQTLRAKGPTLREKVQGLAPRVQNLAPKLMGNETFDISLKIGTVGSDVPPVVFTATNVTPGHHTYFEQKALPLSSGVAPMAYSGIEQPISSAIPVTQSSEYLASDMSGLQTGMAAPIAQPSMGMEAPLSRSLETPISQGMEAPISAAPISQPSMAPSSGAIAPVSDIAREPVAETLPAEQQPTRVIQETVVEKIYTEIPAEKLAQHLHPQQLGKAAPSPSPLRRGV